MVFHTLGLLFASLSCMVWIAESHVRFVCPRPASVRSDISFANQWLAYGNVRTLGMQPSQDGICRIQQLPSSMDYCGVDMKGEFDREYTEVMPGLFTIRFEETQFHRNSPFRVSIHSMDNEDYCVLLDHIPHNNHALFSHLCEQKGNEYPLGICDSSTYYITVNIPDITCDRCYLKLTNILLDSSDKMPCDLNNGTCTGYVSCASIKIRPSAEGQKNDIGSCSRYEDNLAGDWPSRPQDYYNVVVAVGQDQVDPMVTFDPMHRTLHLDIPRQGFPTEIEEVQITMNDSVLWNITVTEENRLQQTVVVLWSDMDDESVDHLQNDHLILRIKCEEDAFEGNITLGDQNFLEGKYEKGEKSEYSKAGWLSDYRFRGPHAEDLTVVTATGPCSPTPRYFISYLHHLQDGKKFMHGILVASILGDYADVTVAFYNIQDDIISITIRGSELLGAPDLEVPVPDEGTNVFQVSLDISQQIPYIDTLQFLKLVEIKTDNPDIGLSGSFEEGMYTLLRDGRDIIGIGAFQFTKGQWLKYEVLITSLESHMYHIELIGDEGVTYNLSHSIWHLDPGFCLVEGLVQDLSSKLLLQLWQGRLRLVGHTNTSTLQGAVTIPGSVYCKEARNTACFFVDLTPDGKAVSEGLKSVPPTGQAVFLLEGSKVLQYSIELHGITDPPHLLEVTVKDGKDLVFCIKLEPDSHHAATFTTTNHLQVSADLRKKLSKGSLKLEAFPPSIKPVALRGFLPPIEDHLCVQPKKRIIGDHRGNWSVEAAPFQSMFAMVGDSLEFRYQGNVTLFLFTSKEDFLSCNFSNSSELTPQSELGSEVNGETQMSYSMYLDHVEYLYFASQQHCNNTPPLKLAVTVIPSVLPSVGDSKDNCGLLVFSDWRQQQLDAYSRPEPTGPAIAGVIVGTLVALAFFFWDRRLQQKAEIAVPGSRFQRF